MLNVNNSFVKVNSTSFGNRRKQSVDYLENAREKQANELKQLAEEFKHEKRPSAIRSFLIVGTLTIASALTAATASGRVFNFLNEIGLKKIMPKVGNGVNYLLEKTKNMTCQENGLFKPYFSKVVRACANYIDKISAKGIETKLSSLKAHRGKNIKAIKKALIDAQPELKNNKELLNKALYNELANNLDAAKKVNDIDKQINALRAANLTKKAVQLTTGTVVGTGALVETAKDMDKNGIPDCAEYQKAKQETTKKVANAILDCAFDSI